MRNALFVVIFLFASVASSAFAGTHKRTRLLHDVYCKKCHSSVLYISEDKRKLSTKAEVQTKVFSYKGQFPLSEKELADIVEYLWLDYYSQ